MKSLEKKSEPMLDMPTMSDFPTFYVDGEQMPEIKKWEVGKTYELKVKVRVSSYNENVTIDSEHCSSELAVEAYEVL